MANLCHLWQHHPLLWMIQSPAVGREVSGALASLPVRIPLRDAVLEGWYHCLTTPSLPPCRICASSCPCLWVPIAKHSMGVGRSKSELPLVQPVCLL